jgi:cellulose synthase/poly-beta-1,6-N-acetylglucosamine synthase-like glycosyltransferase
MQTYPRIADIDPLALAHQHPEMSASVPMTRVQKLFFIMLSLALVLAAWRAPLATAKGFILLSTLFYTTLVIYKLRLVWHSLSSTAEIDIQPDEIAALKDEELPIYSVIVPMYMEPETLPRLVKALAAMDYPADKKDVQLLLEADDDATVNAAAKLTMPPGFRVTLIPASFPRTKPKACNIGLALAKGEFLVIYDAEDRPEPDQLKKAVAAFRGQPAEVVCLQSRLNFYNPRHNLLTRWFTAEYSAWFDLQLPGLSRLDAVIPLGGTSNHFIVKNLREMLGWDAYNVTEDCDLGVRIYRMGGKSRMLKTTTWEEACSVVPFWIPQRTRWLKGYIQTYMVHMRNPFKLLRDLGLANFMNFQMATGGVIVSFLLNPLFWALALVWIVFRSEAFVDLFPGPIFALGTLCLFGGNFIFTYLCALGCYRRERYDLVKYTLITPLYWVLMSYAAWRAFLQFFSNPFYWEKTQHGLSTSED